MKTPQNIDDQRFLQLLEKWLKGDFTRTDERAMEALAASDDFRREAWEGFQSLSEGEHDKHLQALRSRLHTPVGMRAMYRALIATAASMALIAAAVWIMQPNGETSEIAMKTEMKGDTFLYETTPTPQEPSAQAPIAAAPSGQSGAVLSPNGPKLKTQTATSPNRYDELQDVALQDDVAYQMESKDEKADMAMEEVQQAPVTTGAVQEQADNDLSRLSSPNQMPPPQPSAKPIEKEAMDEQVVAASKAKRSEAKKEIPQPAKSEPSGGWKNWEKYVDKNARLTQEAKRAGISGSVILEFLVDDKNQPGYFVVNRPLGYGCDEEAIRLVREFKWVRGKDPQVKVEVKFRL
ncbi:MAG: energy transducer TonB [Saprospiraceae bacterium]|nr:energy transducer TonB [Saprospiraceae bacterium]